MARSTSKARQMQLLRYVRGYQLAFGYSPSFAEMARGLGYSSKAKGAVWLLLSELERRGLIRRLYNRSRAIELIARPAVPLAPDGAPLFAVPGFGGAD